MKLGTVGLGWLAQALVAKQPARREPVRIEILGLAEARVWLNDSVHDQITLDPFGRVQQVIPPDANRSLPVKAGTEFADRGEVPGE